MARTTYACPVDRWHPCQLVYIRQQKKSGQGSSLMKKRTWTALNYWVYCRECVEIYELDWAACGQCERHVMVGRNGFVDPHMGYIHHSCWKKINQVVRLEG